MSSENTAVDVRKGDELDLAAVDAALKANLEGLSGTPSVKQYPSGASNLTYALEYPDRSLVLRRPPTGTRPKSGHDMHREYRIMTELAPAFPTVPKPKAILFTMIFQKTGAGLKSRRTHFVRRFLRNSSTFTV
jgi:aminoglycoside phosphotransferase (APT) family kinase protein